MIHLFGQLFDYSQNLSKLHLGNTLQSNFKIGRLKLFNLIFIIYSTSMQLFRNHVTLCIFTQICSGEAWVRD